MMDPLPFVDEHAATVDGIPAVAWEAVHAVVEASFASPRAARIARLLGCEPSGPAGGRIAYGATLPGFAVVPAGRETLVLEGRHRFARYRLTFAVQPLPGGRSRVTATTHAAFPGPQGRVYRALVIGTRGHVLAVRRMLSAVGRRVAAGGDARRTAFEDECLHRLRDAFDRESPLAGEMEGHRGRLRSLTLERTADDAEVVAEILLNEGGTVTDRFSVWWHDTPPNLRDPHAAREAAFMILVGLTGL